MDITRDLFPTDERAPYLTLTLASRDIASHNLLTALTAAERERLGQVLAEAGTAVLAVLRAAHGRAALPGRTDFGCGT